MYAYAVEHILYADDKFTYLLSLSRFWLLAGTWIADAIVQQKQRDRVDDVLFTVCFPPV